MKSVTVIIWKVYNLIIFKNRYQIRNNRDKYIGDNFNPKNYEFEFNFFLKHISIDFHSYRHKT